MSRFFMVAYMYKKTELEYVCGCSLSCFCSVIEPEEKRGENFVVVCEI